MHLLPLLGKSLRDDDVIDFLDSMEIDVIYDFDRVHEGAARQVWDGGEGSWHAVQIRCGSDSRYHLLDIVPDEGFAAYAHLTMKPSKARFLRVACAFSICGFLSGAIVAATIIHLWAAALGHYFDIPSSAEIVWAHFRFGVGFAFLAATAPCAAALFPRSTATGHPTYLYLAFSAALCAILVFFVRSMCAHHVWDATFTTLFIPPTASVSRLPFFFCPFASAVFTLAAATVLRFACSRHLSPLVSSEHSTPAI